MKKATLQIFVFLLLIASTIALDFILHLFNIFFVGRFLGIAGTLMIILSFLYSMKKWKLTSWGNIKLLLKYHEFFGWVGALLIMVHGGIHFNAVIPWVAAFSMLLVVGSGLTGKYLLNEARISLSDKKDALKSSGKSSEEIEREIETLALMVNTMKKWRRIHMPLTMLFFAAALIHILTILLFWRW